jgi:hypothetical protein
MKQQPIPAYYSIVFKLLAIGIAALLVCAATTADACPFCSVGQPKIIRAISHGPGPDSRWDYLIALAFVVITIATGYYSIKWLIRPGEQATDHIKRSIL